MTEKVYHNKDKEVEKEERKQTEAEKRELQREKHQDRNWKKIVIVVGG